MWASIGAFFAAILEALKLISKRTDAKNTPEMKQRAEAQQEQKRRDEIAATSKQAMLGQTQAERDAALQKAREQDA